MARALRCTHCGEPLAPEVERCPRCLRKSSVPGRPPALRTAAPLDPSEGGSTLASPSYAGVRALVTLAAYLVYGPPIALLLAQEERLEAHGLWLPACLSAMALGTLPLRMAFAPPEGPPPADRVDAARLYGYRMLAVLGLAAGLFVAQALAVGLAGEGVSAIFLGLFFFVAPLLTVPAIVAARRAGKPAGEAFGQAAKGFGIALVVVAAVALVLALRLAAHPPSKPITIVDDPKALLDPLDVASVPVDARWAPAGGAQRALELRADGGVFERTRIALLSAAAGKIAELGRDPQASGELRLVFPAHLDTPDNRRAIADEEKLFAGALAGKKTASGAPILVRLAFAAGP